MRYSDGETIQRTEVKNDAESLSAFFSNYSNPETVMIAMEAGTHSPWISALLSEMGFKVVIGNPRKLKFIWQSDQKSDRRDAEMLARVARFDLRLFYSISHRNRESQTGLAVIKARDALVNTRTALVNSIRGNGGKEGCNNKFLYHLVIWPISTCGLSGVYFHAWEGGEC